MNSSSIQQYAHLYTAIDGRLMTEQGAVVFESSCKRGLKDRVTLTCAIPDTGIEWDPRDAMREDRAVEVTMLFGSYRTDADIHKELPLCAFKAKVVDVSFSSHRDDHGTAWVKFTLERFVEPQKD